jgi:hypothetical protein
MGTKILKILVITFASLALLPIAALFILGYMSQSGEANGLVDGRDVLIHLIVSVASSCRMRFTISNRLLFRLVMRHKA